MSNECNLKVKDSEYEDAKKYKEVAKELQSVVNQYCNVLDEMINSKCLEGMLADNIKEFSELIRNTVNNTILSTVSSDSKRMEKFLSEIDKADEDLY